MKTNILRRLMASMLASATLLPLSSCENNGGSPAASDSDSNSQPKADGRLELPKLKPCTGLDKFEITYYYGPQGADIAKEENILDIVNCGFTSVPIEATTPEQAKAALKLFAKHGLSCSALSDSRINALNHADPEPTQEKVDAVVREVIAEYAGYEFDGWWLRDEPNADSFSVLGKLVSAFRRYDPARTTMINLFPIYANSEQLGTPVEEQFGKSSYEEYLSTFINEVDPHYVSYDHYHFKLNNVDRDNYFTNLELVRRQGLEAGLDQMQIILLTKHFKYANETREQILYDINTSLVYGMKRISYFTYWIDNDLLQAGASEACANIKGEKYQHYYDVQELNREMYPLGVELASKESVGVFHLTDSPEALEKECTAYSPAGDLGAVEGKNAVIGFFDDGSFMAVNKSYSGIAKQTLTFSELSHGLEYFDTASASWKSADEAEFISKNENGNYAVTFKNSEGFLFRVAK